MATPLHFITSNNDPNRTSTNTNTTTTNTNHWSIINPIQPTNHHHPILKPVSNPKPQGRKSGNKSQNGPKNKTPQRGVGMAELERLRLLDEQHSSPSTHTNTSGNTIINNNNNNAINNPVVSDSRVNPLSGVPVIRYCLPGQPISDPRLTHRVESASALHYPELPSMPNPSSLHHSILTSFKKKRVIGEETIGFSKGYNDHFGGFDLKNGDNYNQFLAFNNGGFSALSTTNNGSEVVAIHRKWSGSGNVMMEYGFFPGKSEENMIKLDCDNNDNTINNYYNKMEDLNLKMGFISDSSSPSPSPSSSSSLSSLTTSATTTSNSSVDLSLKLSNY